MSESLKSPHWHNGWLSSATKIKSPNCDQRPIGTTIDSIIIHSIALPPGQYHAVGSDNYIEQLFCNQLDPKAHDYFATIHHLRVSAHFVIYRDGRLMQYVSTSERAWHAGISSLNGRQFVNDFSIGIELEGTDIDPFEEQQYTQLIKLTQSLMKNYPSIEPGNIQAHQTIAPHRKTDPGPGFDWLKYLQHI